MTEEDDGARPHRPESVKKAAVRILGHRLPTELADAGDAEIQEFTVRELLHDRAEHAGAYFEAAFRSLAEGDARMARARYQLRKSAEADLRRRPAAGGVH